MHFGQGSHLSRMFMAYFKNNWAGEVWGLPTAEGSAAATGTITVTSPPTAAGTYHLYIGADHVPVAVINETSDALATAIAAAITANADLPVTASATGAAVTVTCKWKGASGNDILLSHNYYGATGGELMPTGLAVTFTQMLTTGVGDPALTTAISNLGETPVEYVCYPFRDTTSVGKVKDEWGFSDTGRWGFVRQLYGHVFSAWRDSVANLIGVNGPATHNCPQLSVLGVEVLALSPVYEWAAAYTAKAARALANDPARPLQTLSLDGILPAKGQNRFLISETNTLASHGVATQRTVVRQRPDHCTGDDDLHQEPLWQSG